MTAPTVPEHLGAYEYGVEDPGQRFTPADLAAIATYEKNTDWIIGSFDPGTMDHTTFTTHVTDLGRNTVDAMVIGHFDMLRDWYGHLDSLYSGLSNRGPACRMGAAGVRYITAETNKFFHSLNATRAAACSYAFGTAGPRPAVDAGHATFSDLPGIQLDGTTVAESQ